MPTLGETLRPGDPAPVAGVYQCTAPGCTSSFVASLAGAPLPSAHHPGRAVATDDPPRAPAGRCDAARRRAAAGHDPGPREGARLSPVRSPAADRARRRAAPPRPSRGDAVSVGLLLALGAGSISAGLPLGPRWPRLWLAATLLGLGAGAAAAVTVLGGGADWDWSGAHAVGGELPHLRLDGVSALFLAPAVRGRRGGRGLRARVLVGRGAPALRPLGPRLVERAAPEPGAGAARRRTDCTSSSRGSCSPSARTS